MKLAFQNPLASLRGGTPAPDTGGAATATAVKKKKRIKHPVLAAVAVVAAAALVWKLFLSGGGAAALSATDLYTLSRSDVADTISATGTVESLHGEKVYSSLAYPVKELHVQVGDTVKAGDLLCLVDSTGIEKQIQAKELELRSADLKISEAQNTYDASQINGDASVRSAYEAWQKAQKDYDDYRAALEGNLDAATLAAAATVENARASLQNAQADYAAALKTYKNARTQWQNVSAQVLPTGVSAEEYAQAAEQQAARQDEYDQALSVHEQARQEYEQLVATAAAEDTALAAAQDALTAAGDTLNMVTDALVAASMTVSQQAASLISLLGKGLTAYATSFTTKLNNYETARTALDAAVRTLTTAENSYDQALLSAKATYNTANIQLADLAVAVQTTQAAYETAVAAAGSSVKTSEHNLESTRVNTRSAIELELEQLRESLENTHIYSPIDGTVTACYAVENAPIATNAGGLGLLFVIEDVDSLTIEADVDEYDVADLYVGMPTAIRSDAAGSESYEGVVSFIAPTTTKTATGGSTEPGKGKFLVRVSVTSAETNLRIGTGARVSFIREKAEGTLSVPYESVYTNDEGQTCVLLAEPAGDGKARLTECPVELGLENDAFVAIRSDALAEGSSILSMPQSWLAQCGQEVKLAAGLSLAAPAGGGA